MNSLLLQKGKFKFVFFVFYFFFVSNASAEKPILGFTVLQPNGVEYSEALYYSNMLREAIDNTGVYQCLQLSDVSMQLNEQGLPEICTDAHFAVSAGQIVGADFFGFGAVGSIGKTFIISMQIVEVRTGKIIRDISEFHKGKKSVFEQKIIPLFAMKLSGIEKLKKN